MGKRSIFDRKLQKKLQVFGSDNVKIRIQHIKIHRIIWRKSSWGTGTAKLNENRAQITAYLETLGKISDVQWPRLRKMSAPLR